MGPKQKAKSQGEKKEEPKVQEQPKEEKPEVKVESSPAVVEATPKKGKGKAPTEEPKSAPAVESSPAVVEATPEKGKTKAPTEELKPVEAVETTPKKGNKKGKESKTEAPQPATVTEEKPVSQEKKVGETADPTPKKGTKKGKESSEVVEEKPAADSQDKKGKKSKSKKKVAEVDATASAKVEEVQATGKDEKKEHLETQSAYVKVSSYEAKPGTFNRCLLLYSGGLDTSVMLKWIQEQYNCKVVALTLNIGQTADNLDEIKAKAIKLGAEECIVYDARDRFAQELLSEAIMANADYQGGYHVGCPLGRVIISKIAVEEAEKYNCQVIAHGCTGKGNDQVRFDGYITTLNPSLKIIAPVREWAMGRDDEIKYAEEHGIPVKQKKDTPYSYDENMWSNTGEGGEIENPELVPKLDKILQWCRLPNEAPDKPQLLQLDFLKGVPVGLDGKQLRLAEIIALANKYGGEHGVGVTQLIEDRVVGLKVRGVYENPGAAILIAAHKKLEMLVSTRQENELKSFIDQKWAYMTYGGQYLEPTMNHIRAYIRDQNQKVTGSVTVQLFKGTITVVALRSPYSLFDHNLATFNRTEQGKRTFNVNCSAGFIEIYNLPQKTAYNVEKAANI